MSHRQKNKHKSRHRVHTNNGTHAQLKGRVPTGPMKPATVTPSQDVTAPVADATTTATPVAAEVPAL